MMKEKAGWSVGYTHTLLLSLMLTLSGCDITVASNKDTSTQSDSSSSVSIADGTQTGTSSDSAAAISSAPGVENHSSSDSLISSSTGAQNSSSVDSAMSSESSSSVDSVVNSSASSQNSSSVDSEMGSNVSSQSSSSSGSENSGEFTRVNNPYEGANYYIDPEYAANVNESAKRAPSELRSAIAQVAQQPTAVWIDRIAAIDGSSESMGLIAHLDEAVKQQAEKGSDKPLVFQFVVYDLPDRDCSALASNGELKIDEDGLVRYKRDYIDRIAELLQAKPEYKNLRIVAVVEPDSLPNAVTNTDLPSCSKAASTYKEGVTYAIKKLSTLDNVYIYLDMAHSGWLGWDHGDKAAQVYKEVMESAGGESLVQGFATNVSNYSALKEPFNPYDDQNANQDLIVNFYEWNRVIDETTYVNAMHARFPNHHFLIDTGRNGWMAQPSGVPLENRTHRGNWCNLDNAGIGERPQAAPMDGVDAYVWIKPPGASDGTSDTTQTTPDAEGKRFDPMCGQESVVRKDGHSVPTDALSNAPAAGKWFESQFFMLVRNATPAFDASQSNDSSESNAGNTANDGTCTDADLFCENFESISGSDATSSNWSIESRAATASIDSVHARGTKALHLNTTDNGMAFLVPNSFTPANNSFYGRMWLWVDKFPTKPDYAHFTMVEASGTGSSTVVRPIGGQYIPGHANDIPLWGVGSDGGPTGDWTSWQDTTPTADSRWVCMEWQMDASDNAVNIWIDGEAKPELSVSTKKHGNSGDFIFPNFNKIRLGWQLYQGGANPPQFDIWLDDLVLSNNRIGCGNR